MLILEGIAAYFAIKKRGNRVLWGFPICFGAILLGSFLIGHFGMNSGISELDRLQSTQRLSWVFQLALVGYFILVASGPENRPPGEPGPFRVRMKFLAWFITTLIFVGLGGLGVKYFLLDKPRLDDEALQQIADEANKAAPFMVDSETRFDNVMVGNGTVTQYYTLVNYSASEIDKDSFKNEVIPSLKKATCTAPKTKGLFESNLSLRHFYKGKEGEHIDDFLITPADCGL